MSNFPLTAPKPAHEWDWRELYALNVEIVDRDVDSFFGVAELPTPAVSPVILQHRTAQPDMAILKADRRFFGYMRDAVQPAPGQESLVGDFIVSLLQTLDYDDGSRLIHARKQLQFLMCGQHVAAKPDVCVVEGVAPLFRYLLLVQEDKRHLDPLSSPEPQLVAHAIAAFTENNNLRRQQRRPLQESCMFPAILMAGATPHFYKIPITRTLVEAVARGEHPAESTTVERLEVPLDDLGGAEVASGLQSLPNRLPYLRCLEAFKAFLP